jgi:hypothetical protein
MALNAVSPHCTRLDAMAEIFVGVQTSADTIYIITPDHEDTTYVYFNDKNGQMQQVERTILKNSIYDCQLGKYERVCHNTYIIFPYKNDNGQPLLYTTDEMERQFPYAYNYLGMFKNELASRNMPSRTKDTWFAYGRSQSIRRFFGGEHLIWPVLSIGSNYVFDDSAITFTGGGNGPYYGLQIRTGTQVSIFYIQAVLNYWLMEYLVKASASTFRGDYYSHGKQFIASLPIYAIDFDNPFEVKAHADIVRGVQGIMELSHRKQAARTQTQKHMIDRAITTTINRIERILDSLYGINNDEQETT